jgi:YVTN family beta-propeller protein
MLHRAGSSILVLAFVTLGVACGDRSNEAATSSSASAVAPPATWHGVRVYVTNEGAGTLSIIDAASRAVVETVALGKRPRGIQASPDRTKLYVALSGSPAAPPGVDEKTLPPPDRGADGIGEVDVATNRLLRILRVGTDPEQVAVTADGTRLVVANEDAAQVSIVDLKTGSVITSIAVGAEPEGVTVAPDGRAVYVTSEDAGEVYAIDTTSYAVLARIPVGPRPRSVAFTRDGRRAFVTLENGGAVAVIDATAHKFERLVTLGDRAVRPMGLAVDPAGKTMYVTTGRFGKLFTMDPFTLTVGDSIAVGERPWGVAVTPDGATAFTANGPSNDVSVVDLAKKAVVQKIPVGDRPWGVAIVARP